MLDKSVSESAKNVFQVKKYLRVSNLKDVQYASSRCCVTKFFEILAGSVSSVNLC
jgi:hypothetical protein